MRAAILFCLVACSGPRAKEPPPVPAKTRAPVAKKPVKTCGECTVSLKIDSALDADPRARAFEQRLAAAGFKSAPDTGARFFVTFKLKEAMTAAPPKGQEIAKLSYLVTLSDQRLQARLETYSGEEGGMGATLDAATDAALAVVAENVTPKLIADMLRRLDGDH